MLIKLRCLWTTGTTKWLRVKKNSYGVVCLAYLSISTCFRCPKRFCLIGCAILPIAQSIEATIVDWDGYIYIYIYIHTYIHTYIQTYIQTLCETALRDYPPRLTARQSHTITCHLIMILTIAIWTDKSLYI